MQTPRALTLLQTFLFSALVSVLLPASLTAQTTAARPDRGIMPGASYSVSDIENISLTNGNVQLTIPLASLPPIAGGKLKFTVNAVYNSKLWNVTRQENRLGQFYGCPSWVVDTPQLSDLGGWRIPLGYQLVFRNAHEDFDYVMPNQPPTPDCETDVQEQQRLQSQYYRVILIGPDGAEHELRPTDGYAPYGGNRSYLLNYYKDIPNTVGGAMRYYSFDGSYLFAVINPSSASTSWIVYMNDGTRIVQYSNGIQRITDTNGNSIKIFSDANGGHVQDELTGREIRLYNNKVFYKTVTNVEQSIDIVMGETLVQGKIYQVNDWNPTGGETGGGAVCTRNEILQTSVPVIREIVFPATEPGISARRYAFSYNSDTSTANVTDDMRLSCGMPTQPYTRTVSNGMGELSQVVTPSGATVNYSYSKSSINNFSLDTNDIPRATVTQKQVIHDGVTDTWTYNIVEFADCGGVVTGPDGSVNAEQCYPHDPAWARFFGYADDRGGLSYRSRRSDKEVVERHWTMLPFSGANTNLTGNFGVTTFNPVVDVEYLTLLDDTPSHNPVKMSAKKYQYDFNGNLTQQIDYDWFDPGLVTRDSVGVPTGVPASATVLRTTNNSHYNQAATASSTNVYAKRSLSTATPLILSAPQQTTLGPGIVQFSYDGQSYGVAPTVGNLTSKRVWDDLDNKWITTSSTYDVYGNVLTATDGRGKVTQYFYDDATHALPNRVVVDPQNGTSTQTTTTVYDFATGLVTSITDPNNATTTTDYTNQLLGTIDPFARPGVITGPLVNASGVNQHHRVTTTYEDHLLRVVVAADLNTENDQLLKTRTTSDMLGRTVLLEQTEEGANYTLYSQQAYAQAGRISFSSAVMRSGSSSTTDSWTRVTNDVLGRPSEVATFGGATQPPSTGTTATATGTITTAYSANFTTVTDQAGKVRRSMVDALGRLIRVDEADASNNLGTTTAPVQATSYGYDVSGNLTTVTQGSQTRTFTYDSLSRLRTAVNPESGSISYQYDDNGNLVVKTDARGVSSHFEYDSLNRLTRRWYNSSSLLSSVTHNSPSLPAGVGATDEARFYYDTQTLPGGAPSYTHGSAVGRLVAQTYGAGSNGDYYAYDALGRATLKFQQTGAINYQTSATYNLSGALIGVTYPSGHTVTNAYDQAGRLTTFSGNLGDNTTRNYASGILYSPTGGLAKEQFGTSTPVYNKLFYNSRGQLAEVRVSTSYTGPADTNWNRGAIINSYSDQCSGVCSGSGMTDNNGNLKKQDVYIPNDDQISGSTMRSQQYDYDSLNRLLSAREVLNGSEQWKQQYTYDRWGNRTINNGVTYGTGINNKAFTVDTSNNRLAVPSGQSGAMSYDLAGNLTNDTYTGAGNRTYDAENRITSAWGGNNQAQLYGYDASGQRIRRTVDGVETWQVYGFGGDLLAEYPANGAVASPQKEYGYRNGQLLVTADPGSAQQGTQNVSWTNAVGVSVSGNNLTKTTADNWANSGAASSQAIVSGDGYIELTVTETNTFRMIGLSHGDSNQDYTDLDFAAYLATTNLCIYEAGVSRGCVSTYTTGDTIRVAVESGVVKYKKNGAVVYTSTVAPSYPLLVDTALWSNGSTLNSVVISGLLSGGVPQNTQNVNWTGAVGVSVVGNSLTKTTADNWANSGAASSQSITSGDGYVEITASETNTFRMIGLSHGDANQDYTDIDFAAYLATTNLCIYEAGISRGCVSTYTTGDTIRVAVESGVVKYKKNGAVVYTSTVSPSYPLLVDTALWNNGSTLNNVVISGNLSGGSGSGTSVHWLVTDHLGTPRMIIDQTGSLANIKRHDYLPFGEELFAPTAGRNSAQGYSGGDSIRQQFTSKERDAETGLDYFLARYYSAIQGRFTSADEFAGGPVEVYAFATTEKQALFYAEPVNPQTLNKYTYVVNNPLRFVDPNGHQGGEEWITLMLRYFLRQLDPQTEAEEPHRGPLSLNKDEVTAKFTLEVSEKTMSRFERAEALGLDFSVLQMAKAIDRKDAVGTLMASAFMVASVLDLADSGATNTLEHAAWQQLTKRFNVIKGESIAPYAKMADWLAIHKNENRGIVMEVFRGTNKSISTIREQLANGIAYLRSRNVTNVELIIMVDSRRAADRLRKELGKVQGQVVKIVVGP